MLVVATERGYYGQLREPGDKFEVPEGSKASWFIPVPKDKPAKPAAKVAAKEDDSLV